MNVTLRLSGRQYRALREHLLPGDGKEAAAVILSGRHRFDRAEILTAHRIVPIPYEDCPIREPDRLVWRTTVVEPLLREAAERGLGIVKVHSHPGGYPHFSSADDRSDRELFSSIHGWCDDDRPHASVVMLPDGGLFGRRVAENGSFHPLTRIAIAGDDVLFFPKAEADDGIVGERARRHAQVFGIATTRLLHTLSIAVIGCSGTGSIVIELLGRLGIGRLLLVDPDRVEDKNLNRIVNATAEDATAVRYKVDVLKKAVLAMGTGTIVDVLRDNLATRSAVQAVAACDIVIGCMDGHEGRRLLNRLATFYVVPYFDCGVRIDADGSGGVSQACASSHYIQPGGSSLLSRKAIDNDIATAEALRRKNPAQYEALRREKYIRGVQEERPAVISLNSLGATLLVNDLLARIHPFRDEDNDWFAAVSFSLTQGHFYRDRDGEPCAALARHVGRGSIEPLLNLPELSEGSA